MMKKDRIAEEKASVELMIRTYCRRKEGNRQLCAECSEMLDYALRRLDRCKFGGNKPTCRKCPVHCYRPDMRERIRRIMRWSGPRMLLFHPCMAVKHLIRELRR